MGVPCGWVRKFDSRLQIEVMRAHLPSLYKTPGQQPTTLNNDNRSVFVMDNATLEAIRAKRMEAIERMRAAEMSTMVDK